MPDSSSPSPSWVAGADAFRDGWVVVLWRVDADGSPLRRRVVPSVDTLLSLDEAPAVLGLDMIVGLPDTAVPGGRVCDREARQLLGRARGASVFSPPAYNALSADSYEAAQRRNRATGPDAPGLSKQTYHLFPRLRAVANAVTPARQHRIREVHPELAFYALNDDTPLANSKHTDAGRATRRALLARAGMADVDEALSSLATGTVGADDVLDAHAACWTARRIYTGTAERCPPRSEPPPHNARGLRMEIWR